MKLPDTSDTIVAQATPPGAGALAIVRLSGPAAFTAAAAFLSPAPRAPEHARASLLSIKDSGRLVDRVVAVFFKAPASYTGEDSVEITCHGSPYIIRTLLNLAVRAGARPAAPGEFTLRAFLNGKLDLAQAEAVGQLIEASSSRAHRAAITQAEGVLSDKVRGIREELVKLLAQVEARLDDSYEETPPLDTARFLRRVRRAEETSLALAGQYEAGRGIRDGLKAVIAGAPNSGKSSLLNALLGYDRAIVAPTSGTTRDTLEARIEIDGFSVLFTDTAGFSERPSAGAEREGMRRAEAALAAADTVLLVKDSSTKESRGDRTAEEKVKLLVPPAARVLRVYSKSDLSRLRPAPPGSFQVSARNGTGLGKLKTALVREQTRLFSDGAQAVVTSARHFEALSGAARELGALRALLAGGEARLELAAEHLRGAADSLAAILGETVPEEVLADIFGRFCFGK
ncbi:MAG: tRNA uridine-5-carboxymethylaminomethyl(34) synthesis GTPase MnmE [Elusimicrobia bacterium]|nr:tRNA uridine-5-carboxymethylaminomethyl(34) synthesis GTPase MnmE [Elusimicrobiota bacterium]